MALVDLDQDGKADILVAANGGDVADEPNMFYTIDADGNFGTEQVMDSGTDMEGSLYIAVGDLNNDGYQDVVVRNSNAADVYYLWNPDTNLFRSGSGTGELFPGE